MPAARAAFRRVSTSTSASASSATRRAASRARSSAAAAASPRARTRSTSTSRALRPAASASAAARRAARAASRAVSSSESVRSTVAISDWRWAARRSASARLSPAFARSAGALALPRRGRTFPCGRAPPLPGPRRSSPRPRSARARRRGSPRGPRRASPRRCRPAPRGLRSRRPRRALRLEGFALVGEVLEVAPDREEAFARDLRAGGLDDGAAHDDAVLRHERALGVEGRERERVVHVRDDDGVGQRGGGDVCGLRRQELARDAEDARVVRLQRERRLRHRVDEAGGAELPLAHSPERGVEGGAGLEDGRLEGGAERGVERLLVAGGRVEVVREDAGRRDPRGLERAARGLAARLARGECRLERGGADVHGVEQGDVRLARGLEDGEPLLGGLAAVARVLELRARGVEGRGGRDDAGGLLDGRAARQRGPRGAGLPLLELREGEAEPVDEKGGLALAVRGLGRASPGGEEVAARALAPRGDVRLPRGGLHERARDGLRGSVGLPERGLGLVPRLHGAAGLFDEPAVIGFGFLLLRLEELLAGGGLLGLARGRRDRGLGGEQRLPGAGEGVARLADGALVLVGETAGLREGRFEPGELREGLRLGVRRGREGGLGPRRSRPRAGRRAAARAASCRRRGRRPAPSSARRARPGA